MSIEAFPSTICIQKSALITVPKLLVEVSCFLQPEFCSICEYDYCIIRQSLSSFLVTFLTRSKKTQAIQRCEQNSIQVDCRFFQEFSSYCESNYCNPQHDRVSTLSFYNYEHPKKGHILILHSRLARDS